MTVAKLEETPEERSGVRSSSSPALSQRPVLAHFGRYEILGRIATGGMAEIFLARERTQAGGSRLLVIKRILDSVAEDPRFREMFLDEARLAMQLTHPHICHIYEFGRQDGHYFIAMEWVNGVPLGRLIKFAKRQGGIPPVLAAKIISQTAEALEYAHRARDEDGRPLGIVHRDVSPQNIMISYDGTVKLLDFGIAKAESHASKTHAGQVKGKFAYMAPEQCRGSAIDGRADVFALGVCLFEALIAKNLYRRPTEYETMHEIIHGSVPSARAVRSDLPEELEAIVTMALAKDPADRFQSAAAMQHALEHWLSASPGIVTSAHLAELMEKIFGEDRRRGPIFENEGEALPDFTVRKGGADSEPAAERASLTPALPVSRRSRAWLIGLVAFLILGPAAAAGFYLLSPSPTGRGGVATGPEEAGGTVEPERDVAEASESQPEPTEPDAVDQLPSGAELPPIAAGTGSVRIETRPPGARVRVDDDWIEGRTPLTVADLSPGPHPIAISLSGHRPHRADVEVVAGEEASVAARLVEEEAREGAQLSINTRPWSKVYVNNRLLGTTPIGGASVPPGTVRLRLVDRDGTTHERTVRVADGDHHRAFFDLTTPE